MKKKYSYRGKEYEVHFVDKDELAPAFGMAYMKEQYAQVRNDLHPIVQRFVIQHELYHLQDKKRWWGVFGRELRANLIPGCKDPIGLIVTVLVTLLSKQRIKFYLDRIRKKY